MMFSKILGLFGDRYGIHEYEAGLTTDNALDKLKDFNSRSLIIKKAEERVDDIFKKEWLILLCQITELQLSGKFWYNNILFNNN